MWCCVYCIGEPGQNLYTRLQEHKRAVVNGDIKNGITKHTMEKDHQILREEARVIKNEPHLTKRKVKESLLIRRTANSVNLDKGLQLDNIWYPSIK